MSEPMPKHSSNEASYGRDQVVRIINSVLAKVENSDHGERDSIFQELRSLQKIIEDTKREIGCARPGDITDKHIPDATDELDAVVAATADATGAIMDACEVIEGKAAAIGGESADVLVGEVTKIYEACSFQDITGQRIKKVVTTIRTIEQKVAHMVSVLSGGMPGIGEQDSGTHEPPVSKEKSLLNGPQLPDKAFNQDDIDKILSEFD